MKVCSRCASIEPQDAIVCLTCGGIGLVSDTKTAPLNLAQPLEMTPERRAEMLRSELEMARAWFVEFGRDGLILDMPAATPQYRAA